MAISTLTSKGQVIIPKSIRNHLGLNKGSKVEFIINHAKQVIIIPKTLDVEDICGMFACRKNVLIKDMNRTL